MSSIASTHTVVVWEGPLEPLFIMLPAAGDLSSTSSQPPRSLLGLNTAHIVFLLHECESSRLFNVQNSKK